MNSYLSYGMNILYSSCYIYIPSKENIDRSEKHANALKKIILMTIYIIHLMRFLKNIIKL